MPTPFTGPSDFLGAGRHHMSLSHLKLKGLCSQPFSLVSHCEAAAPRCPFSPIMNFALHAGAPS